jgi:hypothetical protein
MLRTVKIARRIDHRYYRVLGRQGRGWDRGHSDQVRAGASKRPHIEATLCVGSELYGISDTHGQHAKSSVPDGDVLIHAGSTEVSL